MFKLTVKQSAAKKNTSSDKSTPKLTRQNSEFTGTLMHHGAMGNQALQRILHGHERSADASVPRKTPLLDVAHGLNRAPVTPRPMTASTNLPINRPGDSHEREADRVAEKVMSLRQSDKLYQPNIVPQNTASAQHSTGNNSSGGNALPPETRQLFEPRFGSRFDNVRVHTDRSANESARRFGARAYTVGQHIAFASGEYNPSTEGGKRLLAHELTHVVQQSRGSLHTRPHSIAASLSQVASPKVQRVLVATGDPTGFAALANSIITVQMEVAVSPRGVVSLRNTSVQGPPTREQQELVAALRRIINDSRTTSIEFIHGTTSTNPADRRVLIGAFGTSQIDLDDIAALGTGLGGTTSATALAHEIVEQYRRQVHGEAFPVAHRAGELAEETISGATRGRHSIRQVNASTIAVTVPWTYPDGRIVDVVMTVTNGNVTGVTRTVRP